MLPPAAIPSLVNSDGLFHGKYGLFDKCAADHVLASDIEREIRAQFHAFRTLTGCMPAFSNGHNHAHVIPVVARVYAQIAAETSVLLTRLPLGIALMHL